MLVKPLEDIERGKTLGTIGITISFRSIRNVLNNAVQNHGNLVVYNEAGTPVYTYSSSDIQDKEAVINDIWKELQSDNTDQSSVVKDFYNRQSLLYRRCAKAGTVGLDSGELYKPFLYQEYFIIKI